LKHILFKGDNKEICRCHGNEGNIKVGGVLYLVSRGLAADEEDLFHFCIGKYNLQGTFFALINLFIHYVRRCCIFAHCSAFKISTSLILECPPWHRYMLSKSCSKHVINSYTAI
jgi:hypothetical protein